MILAYTVVFIILNANLSYGSDFHITPIEICKFKTCVPKCCPHGRYVGRKKACEEYKGNFTLNFRDMVVHDDERENKVSTVNRSFTLVPAKFENKTFQERAVDVSRVPDFNLFLIEKGMLYVETPNSYQRWTPADSKQFCIDYQIFVKKLDKRPVPHIWVVMDDDSDKSNPYLTGAILVSCVFLLLVLVVYALLPELRNLCGLILMAYVFSLFWAFLLLAVIQIGNHTPEVCLGLTFSIYYFFISTFCWMSVMSYDIWWTFRGYAKARPIHRRGEHFKFLMYSLYAFGLPLAMTIGLIVMNSMDLRHMPWIVTPFVPKHGCFMQGGEKLLYLYMPMMILIVCNWIFYLMTAFNVWRLSRGTAVLDTAAAGNPAAHRTQWNRFMVYLKLSVVMGLNWVFEVVSFLSPGFRVWNITDAYNILIGLFIFLIFVCKPKIIRKIEKRYIKRSGAHGRWDTTNRSMSSTASDCASQETALPLVCNNPKGPEIEVKI